MELKVSYQSHRRLHVKGLQTLYLVLSVVSDFDVPLGWHCAKLQAI